MLRESLKLFFAVATNQEFSLRSIDIRAAFLQARELDREVYLLPPSDLREEGMLWKLKKPLYGLNDASRKFWLRVKKAFADFGLRRIEGDEALYFKRDEEGRLEGMISTHVDDFNMAGTDNFLETITEKIKGTLDVSKVEDTKFQFTGIDVEKRNGSIKISMNDYTAS